MKAQFLPGDGSYPRIMCNPKLVLAHALARNAKGRCEDAVHAPGGEPRDHDHVGVEQETQPSRSLRCIPEERGRTHAEPVRAPEPCAFREDPEQDLWMDFSNKVLGKSIVAVIYTSYRTSLGALDYVTKVDNFSFGSRLVNKWMGAFIMRMVGRSRAKMFELPPRENLQYQLDEMSNGIKGDFFGEGEPNGADFANFGILRSMQGLNGFDIVEKHEVVSSWYTRMQERSGVY